MSYQITLYTNKSPVNKVDKEITEVGHGTGVLRASTSIVDPVIQFQTELDGETVSKVNYAYIEAFKRYYHVTDIVSVVTGIWELSMHVDVLMTYRNEIRQQRAIVERQENIYNMQLDDGWFMAYQDPVVITKKFSATNPFEYNEYVLILAGS